MRYGTVDGLDKPVSRLVFGTAFGRFLSGEGDPSPLLDSAVELGVNTFDCAKEYGCAQRMLGRWLERQGADRDKLVIETKGCHPAWNGDHYVDRVSEKDLADDLSESLEQLRTPYIDVYLLHRDDPRVPAGEIVEWLNEHRRKGEIRTFGGSNWTPARLKEANEYAALHGLTPMSVSSPNYSLAVEHNNPWIGVGTTLNGLDKAADREWYRRTGFAVFAYSALARGFMTGMFRSGQPDIAAARLDEAAREGFMHPDNFERLRRAEILAGRKHVGVAQIALAWVLRQNMNVFAIASCSSPAHLRASVDAVDIELDERECAWLNLESEDAATDKS